jgi:hypothetical protein
LDALGNVQFEKYRFSTLTVVEGPTLATLVYTRFDALAGSAGEMGCPCQQSVNAGRNIRALTVRRASRVNPVDADKPSK